MSWSLHAEARADGLVPSDGNRSAALPRCKIEAGANARCSGCDFSQPALIDAKDYAVAPATRKSAPAPCPAAPHGTALRRRTATAASGQGLRSATLCHDGAADRFLPVGDEPPVRAGIGCLPNGHQMRGFGARPCAAETLPTTLFPASAEDFYSSPCSARTLVRGFTEPSGKQMRGPLPCASPISISQGWVAQRLAMFGVASKLVGT